MNKKWLRLFFLLMSFALIFSSGQMAMAQDDDDDALTLEEIVVTGSRIVRDGYDSSSPLAVFDEENITMAGNSSVDEFLKYLPQFTGFQMGKSTNNGSAQGQTKIDVRGLGFNRTLVLINGRRTIGDATGDGAVDINTIPEAMIKQVEVLTDGASSVYGSDAIAGVVNFVLDDEFEGLRLTTHYGAGTSEWDTENYGISMLGGAANDKANIVFSMSWNEQKELLQGERDWATEQQYSLLQEDGTFALVGSGSSNSRTIRVDDGDASGSWTTVDGTARPYEPANDYYNYSAVNAMTQPLVRYQLATLGKIEIAENTHAFFEGMYTHRFAQQRLAPDASFNVSDVDTPNNGTQSNDYVPANNPYNPFGDVACSNTNDPEVCGIGVRINRRFTESGGRLFADTSDQYRMVFGLEGEYGDLFNWNIAYTHAETQTIEETKNYGRFDRWAIAVDPDACAADAACPGVLNPFGDYGSITPEQMSYLTTGSLKDIYNSSQKMFEVNLTGELLELAGGNMGWAAGYMNRREEGEFLPDEFMAGGLTTGGAADPMQGAFKVDEVYAEFLLPVLDVLSFDASARWANYDSVDSSKTTWKLGGDWEVFNGFRLRGTIGTGFRAPNIQELNEAGGGTFPLVISPCEFGDRALAAGLISQTTYDNCQDLGIDTSDDGEVGFQWQIYQEFAAPASPLKPENSDNFTFGFVWDMDVLGGSLVFSADYWDITVEDVINFPDANALFNICMASEDLSSPTCDVWDPLWYWDWVPGDVYTEFGNLGTMETDGVDFSGSFYTDFSGLEFKVLADVTYLMNYLSGDLFAGQVDLTGKADGMVGVFPEWKATVDFGLAGLSWSADLIFRYLSECEDFYRTDLLSADAIAEAMLYTDLVGTYTWNQLRITAGINNLFDETPPYFHNSFNANTEPGMYDVIGRRLFVSASWEF